MKNKNIYKKVQTFCAVSSLYWAEGKNQQPKITHALAVP